MVNEFSSRHADDCKDWSTPTGGRQVDPLPRSAAARPGTARARVAARRQDGSLLCLSDLPRAGQRWTRGRKQIVVECLSHGLITPETAMKRYRLSAAEIAEWCALVEQRGRTLLRWDERPRPSAAMRVAAGAVEIDLARARLSLDGRAIPLTGSEWRVLAALAEAGGHIVTTAMLMGAVYPPSGRPRAPKIIDVLICRIRKKLGTEAHRVGAIWGRGYRLEPDCSG